MTTTAQNTAGRMFETVMESYNWRKFLNVRTGNPEFIKYFAARPGEGENGDDISSMVILSVYALNEHGEERWHKVRIYGHLADRFNEELVQKRQVAVMSCEGYVRQKVIDDPANPGTDRTITFTAIPEWVKDPQTGEKRRAVAVSSVAPHQGNIAGSEEDPFANTMTAGRDDAAMAASESVQAEEAFRPEDAGYYPAVQTAVEMDEAPF